jgi:hypothetical protein
MCFIQKGFSSRSRRTFGDQAGDSVGIQERRIAGSADPVCMRGQHRPAIEDGNSSVLFKWADNASKVLRLRLGVILGVKTTYRLAFAQDDGTFKRSSFLGSLSTRVTNGARP